MLGLALSAGLAQVMTNLDNLALLLALLPILGPRIAAGAYMSAQILVLTAALLLADGLRDWGAGISGYVGLFPISMGLWALWRQWRRSDSQTRLEPKGFGLTTLMFLSLSGDSFAVQAPLILDTVPHLRMMIVTGALAAATLLAGLALSLSRATAGLQGFAERADRYAPYVMIAVGLYILLDSATDRL